MAYISKIDTKFITFINRKYDKTFEYFDDYIVWLYKEKDYKNDRYYSQLENDIWEYSNFQTGSPRKKDRINKKRVAL